MGKYCYNCGAALEEGKPFCCECGARQNIGEADHKAVAASGEAENEASGGGPAKKKGRKAPLIIGIITAGVIMAGVVAAILLFSVKPYELPVRNYLEGIETADFQKYQEALLLSDYLRKENLTSVCNAFEREYGENFKIDYRILDEEELDAERLAAIAEASGKALSRGMLLHMTLTEQGPQAERLYNATYTVVEYQNVWYLFMMKTTELISYETYNTDTSETPVKNMIKGINRKDGSWFSDGLEDSVFDKQLEKRGFVTSSIYMHSLCALVKNKYGDEPITYEITGKKTLSGNEIEQAAIDYALDFTPAQACLMTVRLTAGGAQLDQALLTAVCNGKWRIVHLPDFINELKVTDVTRFETPIKAMIEGIKEKDYTLFKSAFTPAAQKAAEELRNQKGLSEEAYMVFLYEALGKKYGLMKNITFLSDCGVIYVAAADFSRLVQEAGLSGTPDEAWQLSIEFLIKGYTKQEQVYEKIIVINDNGNMAMTAVPEFIKALNAGIN